MTYIAIAAVGIIFLMGALLTISSWMKYSHVDAEK